MWTSWHERIMILLTAMMERLLLVVLLYRLKVSSALVICRIISRKWLSIWDQNIRIIGHS
jgi:hypothetical protein